MKHFHLFLPLFVISTMASASLDKIQGTWKPTSGHIGTTDLPKAQRDKMVLIIKGNTYDYDEGHGHDCGILKDVGGKSGTGMDIVGTKGPNKGRTFRLIYKLEVPTLTICYGLDGTRPTSFTPPAKAPVLVIQYHRAGA